MNPNEFRTYGKDCRDVKKLTKCSDEQLVLQMRFNMDSELKRAIDVNIKDAWDGYDIEKAITSIVKNSTSCNNTKEKISNRSSLALNLVLLIAISPARMTRPTA